MHARTSKEYYGLSKYLENSLYYDNENKMVVHKFKDESKGKRIGEVCAVRPNADCIRMVNEEEMKRLMVIKIQWLKTF